jgi:hypothetical protein
MRKVFFVVVFVLASAGLFAQRVNDIKAIDAFKVNTSDGEDTILSAYCSKYRGQQAFNEYFESYANGYGMIAGGRPDVSGIGKALTKEQWDIVRQVLGRWAHSTGDAYLVSALSGGWAVVVEFTSATQYKYWTHIQ